MRQFFFTIFLIGIGILLTPTSLAQKRSIKDVFIKRIEHSTGGIPKIQWNEFGTIPTYMEGTLSLPSTKPAKMIASEFIKQYSPLFCVIDADKEFIFHKEFKDELAMSHVRFR